MNQIQISSPLSYPELALNSVYGKISIHDQLSAELFLLDLKIYQIYRKIDMPDLMWRTFAWLSISLLKGMSREEASVIFRDLLLFVSVLLLDVVMILSPERAAESLSFNFSTRQRQNRRPLSL